MKAYKVELLILDFQNCGESQIRESLENTKYINPSVVDIVGVDIGEWSDDNPLNKFETFKEEYNRLFK